MNFKELFEGVEPKMPGAPSGIQIMTPQQFVTKAGDMPDEESEEGVTEEQLDEINWKKAAATGAMALGAMGALGSAGSAHARVSLGADGQMSPSAAQQMAQQGFQASAEKSGGQMPNQNVDTAEKVERSDTGIVVHHGGKEYKGMLVPKDGPTPRGAKMIKIQQSQMGERGIGNYTTYLLPNGTAYIYKLASQSANEGVAEGSEQKPAITYKDYTLQYDYQTEDDDPEGYSTATTYYFDVLKDGDRVGEAEYFDYFGNLTIRINGKTKEFEFRHPLASQISQLVSSLPDDQKKDLSDPRFESQGVAEGSNDTIYPNAEVIKSKNGKPVGEIYQDGNSWGAFHYKADRGYDFIDSREEAIEALKDLHQETGRSRPDYTIKGVAEGLGNFAKAIDNLHGWYQDDSSDPNIERYEFDDREGGYYAYGTIEHNLKTGEIAVDFEDKSGEYDGDIKATFNSIGDAMNALRRITTQHRYNTGKAQSFDRLGDRTLAGPDDVYKTDRAGKKGTLTKSRMDTMKMSSPYRKTGPKGVLPEQGVAEGQDHLNRIRKLSGLEEATKLPASSREFGGDEFQDYMKRIVGTPDTDKAGNVKVDKKGNEKYVSGKTKTDRYKMPYIHRSSVVEYLGPDGTTYDEDAVKKTLSQRPKALLKQNEKMKHSNGEFEQFFNVGFAALTGIALDEQTNKLIIVNTCPGAGSCKIDCFAMKGGKIQFKNAWQSDGRILTYLLNDPDGFFNQLSSEISKEEQAGQKGDKKFPKGWQTTIRWHDAGDFFSPEYLDLALKMAAKHPDTKFYAYTKMAGAALGQKPPNFIINWSEGAHTSQEKQVKASDANLDKTKNSRIVPDDLFQDLLVKDEKKNLVKGSEGQWQVQPDKLPELKNRLAKEYGLSANSILDYNQYMAKRKSIPAGMKYNVIVAPGEGDISANDPNIISTLLLKH